MDDLGERLREAISSSVAGAEPGFNVMDSVRRRHRRWLIRATGAGVVTLVAVLVAAVFLGLSQSLAGRPAPAVKPGKTDDTGRSAPAFPGGGRLLTADGLGLLWLYPGGRTVQITGGFTGATISAGRLLAWKNVGNSVAYYTMNLDGSNQRLVLPPEPGRQLSDIQAALSPGGSRLAYLRQQVSAHNRPPVFTLWIVDLATGRRVDLGPAGRLVAWRDNNTILADASDGKALLLINVDTRSSSIYLTVNDPLLVSAYQRARPGAGPPAYIDSNGWSGSGTSSPVAVWLAAARPGGGGKFPQSGTYAKPAELVLAGRTLLASYAPPTPSQLKFSWGPNGLLLIQTGAGDNQGSWNTYVGTLRSSQLSTPIPYGTDHVTFNPAGNVVALQDAALVTFLPTPQPACKSPDKCLHFQRRYLTGPGILQVWAR